MKKLIASLLIVLGLATPALAQLGSVPHTFSPGGVISSSQFNTMFSAIYSNAANRTAPVFTGAATTVSMFPTADNTSDLGSAALSYRSAWFDGTLTVGTLVCSSCGSSFTTRVTATLATEQIRAAFDASNFLSITVASNGATTFDATGAGALVTFSDIAAFTSGFKERGRTALVGEWSNQAYSAGDYTASSGSWTVDSGDVKTNRYMQIGKTVFWQISIDSTDVSATPTTLRVAIPGSLTQAAVAYGGGCGVTNDTGGSVNVVWDILSAVPGYVTLTRRDPPWQATSGDNTGVTCLITFEIA